ncbi:somatomedin-B and thrombospondin type-1 domain-containing protein [Electrophorus electricus]|uniref:somatomedin-B and thrombospondin type-1 domain-containing protein n=1 Tax=Electrophorus electricus TaxID=8005 RepID=UPI0015D0149A|nr:somatomedin-B and thrombospondin type-1 domain-containing protein [Electrophorus electricus]
MDIAYSCWSLHSSQLVALAMPRGTGRPLKSIFPTVLDLQPSGCSICERDTTCLACQPLVLPAGWKHCAGDGEDVEQDRRLSLQWQVVGNPRSRGVWRRFHRWNSCSCPTMHTYLFI